MTSPWLKETSSVLVEVELEEAEVASLP
jgi:hypothetical protein